MSFHVQKQEELAKLSVAELQAYLDECKKENMRSGGAYGHYWLNANDLMPRAKQREARAAVDAAEKVAAAKLLTDKRHWHELARVATTPESLEALRALRPESAHVLPKAATAATA
jgi:hypothetical protein